MYILIMYYSVAVTMLLSNDINFNTQDRFQNLTSKLVLFNELSAAITFIKLFVNSEKTTEGYNVKVPIMSKKFFRSSNSTFHLKNFCKKIFDLDKTQFFYNFYKVQNGSKFECLQKIIKKLHFIQIEKCFHRSSLGEM